MTQNAETKRLAKRAAEQRRRQRLRVAYAVLGRRLMPPPAPVTREEQSATKYCPQCGRILSLSEFYRDRRRADGHGSMCKECKDEKVAQWRATPKGYAIWHRAKQMTNARMLNALRDARASGVRLSDG